MKKLFVLCALFAYVFSETCEEKCKRLYPRLILDYAKRQECLVDCIFE